MLHVIGRNNGLARKHKLFDYIEVFSCCQRLHSSFG